MDRTDDALAQARRLLWEAHGRIKEAMIADEFGALWDWREGELTDWLLATAELVDAAPPAPRVIDVDEVRDVSLIEAAAVVHPSGDVLAAQVAQGLDDARAGKSLVMRCDECGHLVTGIETEDIEVTRGADMHDPPRWQADVAHRFAPGPSTLSPCGHVGSATVSAE